MVGLSIGSVRQNGVVNIVRGIRCPMCFRQSNPVLVVRFAESLLLSTRNMAARI